MYFIHPLSPYDVEPNFWQKLKFIDWLRIFLRLVKSDHSQKFSIIQALSAIRKYGLFLLLLQKYPNTRIVPTQEIDAVLHAHMANVDQFERDCRKLFNVSLFHIPEFGLRGDNERLEWQLIFAQTQELFELNFGQDSMGNSPPACCEILLRYT
ncbi:hypothetical protein [Anabaena sp. UHCC 0399]|uniref:hypothetical protein n=1 Tax=Anabaena sp. UHCC 0399 TaxID=3110238 RepID=UPI002B20D6BB|nr:hypothetical protein [Anabaena sp. UHCC 0399]MEA5568564.1 hypothetical protein [Anabaena sp. UHCC 0399]